MVIGNVIWLFGLSGAGKTTLGCRLARELGYLFLDSDLVRQVLAIPNDFSEAGRKQYQTRLRMHIKELQWAGGSNMVIASITPMQGMRNLNRYMIENYFEVYLKCDLFELLRRDPKGLYAKARSGEISDFTGISSPFEEPAEGSSDLVISTDFYREEECYQELITSARKWEETSVNRIYKSV
jgi:adenylylsulfate kinase